jgi:hypothetical protein
MTEYVVYRHGAAGATAVLRLTAADADAACHAAAGQVTLAPGERLTAEPAADADAKEADLNRSARGYGPAGPPGPEVSP